MSNRFSAPVENYRLHWTTFGQAFRSLNRQAELHRLIAWAKHKRSPGPLRLYCSRLEDEYVRCARYTLISRRAASIARLIYFLTRPFRPTTHYYRKGSAAFYRPRRLDNGKNRLIVLDNN